MRRSNHMTSSVSTTPTIAMTMIGTNSLAVANTLAYSTIMPPSPLIAVKNSATMMPMIANTTARRMPAMMQGKDTARRQYHLPDNLPLRRTIGPPDLQHGAAHVADAGKGVHRDGKDRDGDQQG